MMRQNILKWHRLLSLIIALPVVLWALSGFMHPIMTTIRPKIGTQWLPAQAIDSSQLKINLADALSKNNITQFHNFRIMAIGGHTFYQVIVPNDKIPVYISSENGELLKNGDQLYARDLAKKFLEGVKPKNDTKQAQPQYSATEKGKIPIAKASVNVGNEDTNIKSDVNATVFDCCAAATESAMTCTDAAKITNVQVVENFDKEYKYVNRYLPAYRVNFDREDGIRVYVETAQGRFGYAVDDKRAAFDKVFSLFHTHSWLDFAGKGKLTFEVLLTVMASLTTLLGLYVFFTTPNPKGKSDIVKTRRNHRYTSLAFSLFTLMFTASGAFHAAEKFFPNDISQKFVQNTFQNREGVFDFGKLQTAIGVDRPITNVQLVKMNGENYFQVFNKKAGGDMKKPEGDKAAEKGKDLMKSQTVPPPTTLYVKTSDYSVLPDGEKKYANYLATQISQHAENEIVKTEVITKFEGEYGFVNKRLPVWKVSFPTNNKERFYVETSTGKLAAHVNDMDLIEGYSFSFLHKHHFMDFAGKEARDFSTMFWAMGVIAMSVVGFILWLKMQKKNTP